MLSVHYNGDIVKHPDTAKLYAARMELYYARGRCKFGQREIYCPVYMDYIKKNNQVKHLALFSRCQEYKSKGYPVTHLVQEKRRNAKIKIKKLKFCRPAICPVVKELQDRGKKEKSFIINQKVYRRVASAGHNIIRKAKNRAIFITLTFPRFTRVVTDNEINEKFSQFIENLRRSKIYRAGRYVAVKEYGDLFGRVHFHIVIDMPFVNFAVLNRYWCRVISDICVFSSCAVRAERKKTIIYDYAGALRYVCKYFSKARNKPAPSRLVFISHDALIESEKINDATIESILTGYKGIYIKTYDYTTVYSITDKTEFRRFCWNFIYPLFCDPVKSNPGLKISDKKPG